MAAIVNADIKVIPTDVEEVDRIAESNGAFKIAFPSADQLKIISYTGQFNQLIGPSPTHSLLLSTASSTRNPFFHDACVFLPTHDELYITSNLLQSSSSSHFPTIIISRVKIHRGTTSSHTKSASPSNHVSKVEWVKMRPPKGIDMPSGGTPYQSGMLFCSQGNPTSGTGGIYYMPRTSAPIPLITNFHGRDFNSVSDVVVADDGAIWFTDPSYGFEHDFRQKPKLPNHVYRFEPETGAVRVMADGFEKPNSVALYGDTCYVSDTGSQSGFGTRDLSKPATIYAFDVPTRSSSVFLTNKRVFAYAAVGFPAGLKCDVYGNVYAGCGDGVEVWNAEGSLIGRILVEGGVTSFCFGTDGEMFLCNEQRLWRVQFDRDTRGDSLDGRRDEKESERRDELEEAAESTRSTQQTSDSVRESEETGGDSKDRRHSVSSSVE